MAATAQATLAAAIIEKQSVAGESESLGSTIAARNNKLIEDAVRGARTKAEIARAVVEAAQEKLTAAIASHAQHGGRLVELLRLRDAEDLAAAETQLRSRRSVTRPYLYPSGMLRKMKLMPLRRLRLA